MTEYPTDQDRPRSLNRSDALLNRARDLIPGCTQTGSKGPTHWVQGVVPTHLQHGEGSHVWDVDGNEYIDYVSSLGPIVLGHDYPAVTDAVTAQIQGGTMFSLPHPLQVEVAEQLRELVPCAEMVRFAKNGNDATTLAAKLARAHTGREVIATQGYHGWSDTWMGATAMNRGIPEGVKHKTVQFEYNDIESLERIFDDHPGDVAAVVTTPVNLTPPENDFLERVREITEREGALLVFDEVLTGFRFAVGGAQEFFDVVPDLGCFAKGLANGYPISTIAGRRDVMKIIEDEDFFFSQTYAGETVSLTAANVCISVFENEPVIDHLFAQGEKLRNGYNDLATDHGLDGRTECRGYPPRSVASFRDEHGNTDAELKSLFIQECLKRGVLFSGTHLPNYSHTDADIERTLAVYDEAMAVLADAVETGTITNRLDGDPVGATLRQRTGEES
jgi:glutamate-1-semialdehyde aminotransferase